MKYFSLIFLPLIVLAETPRISSEHFDLSTPKKIYLRPGLISVISFPQSIQEVKVGNPLYLKAVLSQNNSTELTLYFKNSKAVITNLIVRSERKVFIFDVVPSLSRHQDYIKISSSYNSPIQDTKLELIDSSIKNSKKIMPKSENLIERLEL